MEENIVSSKRKAVSFADQEQKRKRKTHITESASPSRYRTRAAVREEAASTPTKSVKETVSPGRTARQQGSATNKVTVSEVVASTPTKYGKSQAIVSPGRTARQ
jgi:hypothetical protein